MGDWVDWGGRRKVISGGRGERRGGSGMREEWERSGRVRGGGVEGRNDCSVATDVTKPATQNTFHRPKL